MKKIVALLIVLFLVPLTASAQDYCEGNFDYDDDQDGTDAFTFKTDFGRSSFGNPCPPDGPAPVPRTGQTTEYTPGDDGYFERGVEWPNPRFTDNEDGTVTDNLTGLLWLKNANCFGSTTWSQAVSDCNGLASGSCELTDGSNAGDWRLPNKKELISLTHDGYYNPAIPNSSGTGQWSEGDPFTNVESFRYLSSSTCAFDTDFNWNVNVSYGEVFSGLKSNNSYVWPVRGGHGQISTTFPTIACTLSGNFCTVSGECCDGCCCIPFDICTNTEQCGLLDAECN